MLAVYVKAQYVYE